MKILHVLSQLEVTGAEVYAVELAQRQAEAGHSIVIVSDTLTLTAPGTYHPFPVSKRSYARRARAIAFLARLVRREGVNVIHAHSRAASWVAHFASLRTGVPLVSTVHGRQHLHASLHLFNVYGHFVIAVNRELKAHLIHEVGIPARCVTMVPNGVTITDAGVPRDIGGSENGPQHAGAIVVFIGRLTGPKGDVVRFLVDRVMPILNTVMPVTLEIVGGQIVPPDIPGRIHAANEAMGREAVVLHGFQKDLRRFFSAADVVIGSGRVVIEAMLEGTPSIAFGETCYQGYVTPENVASSSETNFGDTGCAGWVPAETVVEEILRVLQHKDRSEERACLQEYVHTHFDVRAVEKRVAAVYRRALASRTLPGNVPVLMYHRIVRERPTGSRHGTWVSEQTFAAQLRSLAARRITPITFRHYHDFLLGTTSLPRKPILLTFDDGYEDNYSVAFPLLQRYGFPAVVFLVADFARRTNFWDPDEPPAHLLNAEQIRTMDAAGIEFGSHTVTHPRLTVISAARAREEMLRSKGYIEDLLGRPIYSLCYPYGDVNEEIKEALFDAGYEFGIASDSGPRIFSEDLGEIRRTQVFPDTGAFGFWKKSHPWYLRYRSAMGK